LAQFLIPTDTPGVTITPLDSVDLTRRFASVRFVRASVPGSTMLGDVTAAPDQIERQLQIAIVLQCAETCGAMARAFEFTVEYMQDRFSFGRPIASYQALKHRVADIKMWLEASHATTDAAARAVSAGDVDAGELAGAAKAYVGPVASEIIQDCVQLHGGIGVTWEHDLHLYLRRVTINHSTYGSPTDHLERIARDIGLTATTPGAIR
jgi:alkylation response protein AidB-like acyl-CoA dehydrogenase